MKTLAVVIAMLIGATGFAIAQEADLSKEDIATLRSKMENLDQATAAKDADAVNIDSIQVRVNQKGDKHERRGNAVVTIQPTDPEFADVLAALKSIGAKKVTAETNAIKALGVNPVKEPVEAPVEAAPAEK